MSTTIALTQKQRAKIAPLLQALQVLENQGRPGALVAQVYGGSARMVLMDQNQAMKFNAAMAAAGGAE